MVMTNFSAQALTWRLGSSLPNMFIGAMAIGSGSGTSLATNTVLFNERVRNVLTGSPDFTVSRKVQFQADYSSPQMSGTHMTEFGLFQSGALNIGSVWQRESFGSIIFDGTNELQVISNIEIIPR